MARRSRSDEPILYRGLLQAFRDYFDLRSAWPQHDLLLQLGAPHGFGRSNGLYKRIKRGDYVDQKRVAAFIGTMLAPPSVNQGGRTIDPLRDSRGALFDFLRKQGVPSPATLDLEAVLAYVCTVVTDHTIVNREWDWLKMPFTQMGRLYDLPLDAARYVQACHPERPEELRQAVHDIYASCGRAMEPSVSREPLSSAVRVAERVITMDLDAYVEQAAGWRRFNPWTVVRAWDGRRGVGALVMLPLKPTAYEQILEGQRAGFEMTPDDLTVPCRHLWMEACAEAPWATDDPKINPTKALRACMMVQTGALVQAGKLPDDARLKVLTFSGTPRNRERLLQNGFNSTGRTMARAHVELLEREFPLMSGLGDFITPALLHHFGKLYGGPPPYHE